MVVSCRSLAAFTQLVAVLLTCQIGLADKHSHLRDEDGVIKLDQSNFDLTLNTCKHSLVEFYAPWCGHCKKLAPEYAKTAKHFIKQQKKGLFEDVCIIKVDASDSDKAGDLATRYGISGFPTLKIFRGGTFAQDYNGERSWKDMAAHLRLLSKSG